MKIMMKRIKASSLKAFMTFVDTKRLKQQNYPMDDLIVIKDIPYVQDGHPLQRIDILSQKEGLVNVPTIINIHGGGLIYGDKELNQNFNAEFARRGFRVISLSYRLLPRCTFDEQVQDILNALSFIHEHAQTYSINLDDIFMTGDSAGGLLTLFAVALTRSSKLRKMFNVVDPNIHIKGMGLISSMLDIGERKDIIDYAPSLVLQGKRHRAADYIYKPAKLFNEVAFPPCYLVTSSEDFIRTDTLKLKQLFDQKKIKHELLDWTKGDTYRLEHVFPVTYPKYQESQKTIEAMVEFLTGIY
ncbi:MAG: alpha/beta hydrolase [Bacilli bacterium]|nr:alpha/beta hydrolase [Bacilli bacterium]